MLGGPIRVSVCVYVVHVCVRALAHLECGGVYVCMN